MRSKNKIVQIGEILHIYIMHKGVEFVALVNSRHRELVERHKWRSYDGYVFTSIRTYDGQTKEYLHRMLLGLLHNDSQKVDHIDCNGLNNLDSNIRVCTTQQNGQNSRIPKNNTSGVKGVSWNKRMNKWQAIINFGNEFGISINTHLGYFTDIADAEAAVLKARAESHGEYARNE